MAFHVVDITLGARPSLGTQLSFPHLASVDISYLITSRWLLRREEGPQSSSFLGGD